MGPLQSRNNRAMIRCSHQQLQIPKIGDDGIDLVRRRTPLLIEEDEIGLFRT